MEIRTVGEVLGDPETNVKMAGTARATGVSVVDGQITLSLEADVIVEMAALSRMWVKAYDLEGEVLRDLDDSSDSSSSSSSDSSSSSSSSTSGSSSSSYTGSDSYTGSGSYSRSSSYSGSYTTGSGE